MLSVLRLLWLIPLVGFCVLSESSLVLADEEHQGVFTEPGEVKNTDEAEFPLTIFDKATPRINRDETNLEIENETTEQIDTNETDGDATEDYQGFANDYPEMIANETDSPSVKEMLEGRLTKTDEGLFKAFDVIRNWIKESEETNGKPSKEIDFKNVPMNGQIENAQVFQYSEETTTIPDDIADKAEENHKLSIFEADNDHVTTVKNVAETVTFASSEQDVEENKELEQISTTLENLPDSSEGNVEEYKEQVVNHQEEGNIHDNAIITNGAAESIMEDNTVHEEITTISEIINDAETEEIEITDYIDNSGGSAVSSSEDSQQEDKTTMIIDVDEDKIEDEIKNSESATTVFGLVEKKEQLQEGTIENEVESNNEETTTISIGDVFNAEEISDADVLNAVERLEKDVDEMIEHIKQEREEEATMSLVEDLLRNKIVDSLKLEPSTFVNNKKSIGEEFIEEETSDNPTTTGKYSYSDEGFKSDYLEESSNPSEESTTTEVIEDTAVTTKNENEPNAEIETTTLKEEMETTASKEEIDSTTSAILNQVAKTKENEAVAVTEEIEDAPPTEENEAVELTEENESTEESEAVPPTEENEVVPPTKENKAIAPTDENESVTSTEENEIISPTDENVTPIEESLKTRDENLIIAEVSEISKIENESSPKLAENESLPSQTVEAEKNATQQEILTMSTQESKETTIAETITEVMPEKEEETTYSTADVADSSKLINNEILQQETRPTEESTTADNQSTSALDNIVEIGAGINENDKANFEQGTTEILSENTKTVNFYNNGPAEPKSGTTTRSHKIDLDLEELNEVVSGVETETTQYTADIVTETLSDNEATTEIVAIFEDSDRSSKQLKAIASESLLAPQTDAILKDGNVEKLAPSMTETTAKPTTVKIGFNEKDEEIIEDLEKEILMDNIEEDILEEEIEKLVVGKVTDEETKTAGLVEEPIENIGNTMNQEVEIVTENTSTTLAFEETSEAKTTPEVIKKETTDSSDDYEEELELMERAFEESAGDLQTNQIAEETTSETASSSDYEESATYSPPYEMTVSDASNPETTTQTAAPATTESYGVFNFFRNIYGIVRGSTTTEKGEIEVIATTVQAEAETTTSTSPPITIAEYIQEQTTLASTTADDGVDVTTIAEYLTTRFSAEEPTTAHLESVDNDNEKEVELYGDRLEIIKDAMTEEIQISEQDYVNNSGNSADSLSDLFHSNEAIIEYSEQEDQLSTMETIPKIDMDEDRIVQESKHYEVKAEFKPAAKDTILETTTSEMGDPETTTVVIKDTEQFQEETIQNEVDYEQVVDADKNNDEQSTEHDYDHEEESHKNLHTEAFDKVETNYEEIYNNRNDQSTNTESTASATSKYDEDEDYDVISKLIEAFDVVSTNGVEDNDELTSEEIDKLHQDIEDLGQIENNVEDDVEEIENILKRKKVPNANKNAGLNRIVGSIYNYYGDACLNLNLSARININNTIVTVPPNAIVKGNCSNSEVHVKISWRSMSDKNSNNSIYFVMKIEGNHYFISYVHMNLLDQKNKGKEQHELLDLQALTSDGKAINKSENLAFKDKDVTLELIDANLKVQEYFGTLGGSVTLAYGNAFILQIASGCVCVLIVLVVLGYYMYKKTRSKERVFNVNDK